MTKHLVVLLNQLSEKDGEVSLEHLDKHALRELLNEVEGEDHHVNLVITSKFQLINLFLTNIYIYITMIQMGTYLIKLHNI